jgi:hypothetical protein
MTINSPPAAATLEIVTTGDTEGTKGFFTTPTTGTVHSVMTLSVADLAERMESAMRAIGEAITRVATSPSAVSIEKAEISLEITAKGEVRLIASGSLETKGAIKLTVVPRR